jgi:hypothetical protein
MNRAVKTLLSVAAMTALAAQVSPSEAQACGGTFCDGGVPGPQQMPVDQTGENILFVIDGTQVEAHIQIQYEGDPENFAWIVPVQALPDIEVGSQTLFDNLLDATVPTFTLDQQTEPCNGQGGVGLGCAFAASSRDEAAGGDFGQSTGDGGEDDGTGGPEVVKRGFAGAFQYDVLQGGTIDELTDWLILADYLEDDDAPPILEEYLEEDFLFVAFKLRGGVGIDEIHPVMIRYEGMEPCVPIRLTRIAAVPDMGIRAFFLGEDRVAPKNYKHVELNPLKFNWLGVASGTTLYNDTLTQAVDEAEGGHGFVTEYAGTSSVVSQAQLLEPQWMSAAFVDAQPVDVVDILESQNFMSCDGFECIYEHPMVEPLLADYLPVPNGVNAEEFYSCLECFEDLIDQDAWDGAGFAADMEERIIVPGEHAKDVLDQHDYLTRMYTTISPDEMTVDPLFLQNADLPDVSNQFFATRWFACEGPDWLELDDGRIVAIDPGGVMPEFEDQPYATKVQTIPAQGAPMDDEDNRQAIDASLDEWNESQRQLDQGGCGCSTVGLNPETVLLFSAVFGFAAAQRRRRR